MKQPAPAVNSLAALPSMTALLDAARGDARFATWNPSDLTHALRACVDDQRRQLQSGEAPPHSADGNGALLHAILAAAAERLRRAERSALRRVINATGIVLHTGLGRAPLPAAAVAAVADAAGYCNLELDLDSGARGRRAAHLDDMLCRLTGCEAALIVNNNAAATVLVLAGLAAGREVVISRGQLIEIGGAFRLPDVMAASGCLMREVGTTNKTRLGDYERALTPQTALLLHVHPSNYRVEGFAESPSTADLVGLARRVRAAGGPPLSVYDDLGSGALMDDPMWLAAGEPTVPGSLRAGADVISFSGDKLLGGPQCGIILGRRELVERLRIHPLARAMRVDKLTIAALQAVLPLYADPARAAREIPTLAMLNAPVDALRHRAERLCGLLRTALPVARVEVRPADSFAGGGSLPTWKLPTVLVVWHPEPGMTAQQLSDRLRAQNPPVVARIEDEALCFDLRTVAEIDLTLIATAARAASDQARDQ